MRQIQCDIRNMQSWFFFFVQNGQKLYPKIYFDTKACALGCKTHIIHWNPVKRAWEWHKQAFPIHPFRWLFRKNLSEADWKQDTAYYQVWTKMYKLRIGFFSIDEVEFELAWQGEEFTEFSEHRGILTHFET